MSDDEIFIMIVSSITGLVALSGWFLNLATLKAQWRIRLLLGLTPVAAFGLLFLVLKNWASSDVRDSTTYLSMYMALGAGWFGFSKFMIRALGVSVRDDGLERQNAGAAYMGAGALIGFMACFAGGNIGDGPGWWVVAFAAGLAAGTLSLLWVTLNQLTGIVDRITIDRDVGSGLRAGAFFISAGLILGRAVAGNWISGMATVKDFAAVGWPALILLGAAAGAETLFKPIYKKPASPLFSEAFLPALTMGLIAFVVLWFRGGVP